MSETVLPAGAGPVDGSVRPVAEALRLAEYVREHGCGDTLAVSAELKRQHEEIIELKELADSEGTRAVNYLRRARKAESVLEWLHKDAAPTEQINGESVALEMASELDDYSRTINVFRRGEIAAELRRLAVLAAQGD